ncbi:MAG: 3-oxoacyl-[acyl-carrier-protein] synthase III C-terminal domain-containing protein [Patescibacteria group bacterium]
MPFISQIATWLPPYSYTQAELVDKFGLGNNRAAKVIFRRAQVDRRYFSVPAEVLLGPCREERFFPRLDEIIPEVPDVDSVVEVSNLTTAYAISGKRYAHYGWCPGSVFALDYAKNDPGRTLIVACNLQSYLRWSPDFTNSSDVVNYSIMGDAMSVVLVECGGNVPKGCPEILGCVYQKEQSKLVGMVDGKFHLDAKLPAQIPLLVEGCLDALQNQLSVGQKQISYWIVHPGGIRILNQIEQSLSLPKEALHFSKETLREHGNISGSSVFFVLKKVQEEQPKPGSYGVIVTFGPGQETNELIAAACILRWK